jgi:PAS domain S-box-containing protein
MISLPNIAIQGKIYESSNSLVYRGTRKQDNLAVILKVLKQDYPTPSEIIRYQQEYEITRSLNLDGVIKAYAQQKYQRTLVILLEDFGGESIERCILRQPGFSPIPLSAFLPLAIDLTDILSRIHAAGVIHKDINPSNIILNSNTGVVKIIDFGIATRFNRTNPTFRSPHGLEGTLAYLSPEQTGRMNRWLDYRTDFYSLGATFYELLTGQLPFPTTDVLELVHYQIAKQPVPPHKLKANIPKAVSDIILKLMAKNAEDRYQSAWGIKADLESCARQFAEHGQIASIQLSVQDVSDQFQISQKLYGRDQEIALLMEAFERVASPKGDRATAFENHPKTRYKVAMTLVSGYAGIGKSALVQELYKSITEKRGYFISGKFDQFQRNIPYSAIVNALRKLVQQLLCEPGDRVQQWRSRLLTALGNNGQLIIDVIPEVELIIGKQPTLAEVGSTEAQNRFNLVFPKFIRACCSYKHPLVIFLDDLQWVDSATLKLMELMLSDREMQYLLLIGAYRDNEVSQAHPLCITIEKLKQEDVAIDQIMLTPLTLESVTQLMADTFHSCSDAIAPLAELVWRKTNGNPYFTNEFLKTLYTEALIGFDRSQRCWQWNLAQIEAKNITDNVVELMLGKLRQLPGQTQHVLQLAACVGAEFDLVTLSVICERSMVEVFAELTIAIQSELILPTSELDENLLIQHYKFLHDRVQQAAYTLIAEEQKQAVHLQIGYLLLQSNASETAINNVFEVVDHLNLGRNLITEQQERDRVARLNLTAGEKAKTTSAHRAALQYLTTGIDLLAIDSWQTQYALTLILYEEATEAAYLCGNFQQMEQWAIVVVKNAITILDSIKVYRVRIQNHVAQGRQAEAIKVGLEVLRFLGILLPELPTEVDIQHKLTETITHLDTNNKEYLLDLPRMREPKKLAAIQILASLIGATFQTAPGLLLLIICEQINLSVQYGNDSFSSFAYATYGALIRNGIIQDFQDFEEAYQFGNLARNLGERLESKNLRSKVSYMVGAHIMHCKDHIRQTFPLLQESYETGLETGDVEYSTYSVGFKCMYSHFAGLPLAEVELETRAFSHVLAQLRQENILNYLRRLQQLIFNLIEPVENPGRLLGRYYNEDHFLPIHLEANDRTHLYHVYLYKLILSHLFEDFSQALDCASQAELYLDGVLGTFSIPVLYFYDSLVRLALYPSVLPSEQEQLLLKAISNQEKMQRWAHHAPANFQHKYNLIEAEKARILGHTAEAMNLYEQSIAGAKEHQFLQEEALAYELAAKFYLAHRMERIAQTYLKEAHYCYQRWGAKAKVAHLEAKHPEWFAQSQSESSTTAIASPRITTSNYSDATLDLATVMKASQAIFSQIELDQLLRSLMKILIENAGAQTGFLILETSGAWAIEASGKLNSGEDISEPEVLQSIPIENHLPESIINYVIHTHEDVALSDATREGNFINDPYIQQYQTKSILCLPLLNQSKLIGVLYLENQLAVGVFTPEQFSAGDATRTQVLHLLSTQAAIAIENAKLYSEIRASESRMAQFLEAIPVGIGIIDAIGRPYYVNQRGIELMGKGVDPAAIPEQITEVYQLYVTGTDQIYPTERLPIVRALSGERTRVDDIEVHQNNTIIPCEGCGTPVFDEQGNVIYAIVTFQDITERKQTERLLADYNRILEKQVTERTLLLSLEIEERQQIEHALRQSEEQRRLTMDFSNIGSWNWNIVEDTVDWDDNHIRLLGLVPGEVESSYQAWRDRVHPEDIERIEQVVAVALATHTDYEAEYRVIYPDSSVHWLVGRGRGIYNQASQPVQMLGVILDISEQRNAALRERKRAEEASILEERNRMAREIHDALAQAFTGILLHAGSATQRLVNGLEVTQSHLEVLEKIDELARTGLAEARRSVTALRPLLLEESTLQSALHRLVVQMQSTTKTTVIYEGNDAAYPLPAEMANHLLRIGQEALTNAIKYANASEILVELIHDDTQCLLRIKDNGQGFGVGSIPSAKGFGLLGMSERAEQIGAQLTIQSQPGQGTEITVNVNRE